MKKALLKEAIISVLFILIVTGFQSAKAQYTETISINHTFGAFATNSIFGPFTASSGDHINIQLNVASDDEFKREVRVQIAGTNEVICNETAHAFNETININTDGSFLITIFKNAPFYTTIDVNGEIVVYHTSGAPTPSTSYPAVTASLAESASALNYGNTVNFTVSADGGTPPYIYVWYMDNQTVQTSASPYYSTNNQTVGSHHVYVQVTDADNNSATTLTVEFNVLPVSSSSASLSPGLSNSPTQQPTQTTTTVANIDYLDLTPYYTVLVLALIITLVVVALFYYRKHAK